ncbi:hypothetical protein JTE90_022170 [Oedothorax gibbosus]|uniref:Uncharacterized protein n=1 Tax=Oedothorax gibbosus TaxID=931172 RepID=A0AAV6VNM4_9ARAC|nr:hypothetical protein JTE90_022170 [Oedothorax gibbosus]
MKSLICTLIFFGMLAVALSQFIYPYWYPYPVPGETPGPGHLETPRSDCMKETMDPGIDSEHISKTNTKLTHQSSQI